MPNPDSPETTRPTDKPAERNDKETGLQPELRRDDSSTQQDAQRRTNDTNRLVDGGTLPRLSVIVDNARPSTGDQPHSGDLQRHEPVSTRAVSAERVREIQGQFPALTAQQQADARRASDADLAQMKMRSLDGSTETSVAKLLDDPKNGLTAEHRELIRQTAAEVRAHFKQIGGAYQDANWEHTAEEVGHALKIANKLNLSSAETTKLVLTSLLSDSVKTPQNFFTHHIDGAVGWNAIADRVLKNLPEKEREIIKRDVERAILTHQISPPGFMSNFHARMIREGLKGDLDKAASTKDLTADEKTRLTEIKQKIDDPKKLPFSEQEQELLKKVCDGDPELLKHVQDAASIDTLREKLFNPLAPKNRTERDGMSVLNLDAKETGLLKRLGFDRVWVPDPKSPSYKLEIAAIAADSGQYASVPGKFKYTILGGPDTVFHMPTLDASWANPEGSGKEITGMLHEFPELNQLSTEELVATQKVLKENVSPKIRQWVDQQPDVPKNSDGTVAYLDAPLKYPAALDQAQQAELKQLQGKGELNTAEQSRLYELQHNGLTPLESKQYDFARQIKAQAASIIKQEFQYKETAAPADSATSVVALDRSGPRKGGRNAGREGTTDVASTAAPGDIKESAGGGFDVAVADKGARASERRAGEELTEARVRELKEQIIGDKTSTLEEKTAALRAIDLASRPAEVEARKVVVEAQREARRSAGEGGEGTAVGVGIVVLALASYYTSYRQKHAAESYIPKARVN